MEKLFNDRARLIALLELLPEQFIDDLVNDYLWNANYPQHFNLIFDKYKTKRKEILFQFSNPKIKKVFTKFNEDFDSLMNFLITNFAVPKSMHHQETNLNICYLQPRIHHNFRLSEGSEKSNAETDSIKWNEYKVELDGRATIFENSL